MQTSHTDRLAKLTIDSPLGELRIAVTQIGVVKLGFPGGARSDFNAWLKQRIPCFESSSELQVLDEARAQLEAYFAGRLRQFSLPLDLRGSPFQVQVWRRLADIPYGETITYGELARALGKPGGMRAVGAASGANPLPIVLPCHRVVASGGKLGGFGGGLDAKRTLLVLEQRLAPVLTAV